VPPRICWAAGKSVHTGERGSIPPVALQNTGWGIRNMVEVDETVVVEMEKGAMGAQPTNIIYCSIHKLPN